MSSRLTYKCSDDRWVVAASNEPRTWAKLCEALNVPELAGHRIGVDDEAPVIARLREVFATKPAAEWCVNPGFAGGIAPVNEPIDLLDDPQFTTRGDMVALEGSTTRVLASPVRLDSDGDGAAATLGVTEPPTLGQHTDEVLTAAGFSAAEIAAMREAGLTV
jgi:crotonobetainyl-CoA:carnitine CoA-transferase CaiB-like acyl-CoA transferase